MKKYINQKGVTLIEILVSIVILSIIIMFIMRIFPQMVIMNNQNEFKSKEINTTKVMLINWQKATDIKSFLANQTGTIPKGGKLVGNTYNFTEKFPDYDATILINNDSELQTGPSKAFQIHIILTNKKGKNVSEIYGYIII